MKIRDAVPADAPAACEVLRRSIIELCAADHRNDPVILERWLANKTPEIVASWIAKPGNSVLVAAEGDVILAVGSVTDEGEVTLNRLHRRRAAEREIRHDRKLSDVKAADRHSAGAGTGSAAGRL
ncbi:MAG: hypothetical protein AUG92_02650 [Alphaproteobacteria bacterium 13_1_20CM_4_65_11]|nr:MAG: hypothetical protein AUG92_02650 [Alphaproteobacteria bacterium 13_1_20CM_4_65_11]